MKSNLMCRNTEPKQQTVSHPITTTVLILQWTTLGVPFNLKACGEILQHDYKKGGTVILTPLSVAQGHYVQRHGPCLTVCGTGMLIFGDLN